MKQFSKPAFQELNVYSIEAKWHKVTYFLHKVTFSGALIATASSAPIGVSNIVNLIALKIVGMTLYMHTLMMFVPATTGLVLLLLLLFLRFRRRLPRKLSITEFQLGNYLYITHNRPDPPAPHLQYHPPHPPEPHPNHHLPHPPGHHPQHHPPEHHPHHHPGIQPNPRVVDAQEAKILTFKDRNKFMRNVLIFVFIVRMSLFAASYLGIPIASVAVIGSSLLLTWRWIYANIPPPDLLTKIPWHIFVFAFSMYVIIYGLNNIGLTNLLIKQFEPLVTSSLMNASLIMGILTSLMSMFFNNHPSLLIGTLTLMNMNLDPLTLKIAYLASVIGSDVGSLVLPIGTLASLMWMHILNRHDVKIHWKDYISVTILVIPVTVLFTLIFLERWVDWLFKLIH